MGRESDRSNPKPGSGITAFFPARENGIVFMDLLVGLCLSLMTLAIMLQLTGLVYGTHSKHASQAELHYSARMALDCIEKDLRCARDFQVSADGSKLLITDGENKNIRIFVQSTNLYRQDVSNIPVAENLSAVHFSKNNAGLLGRLDLKDGTNSYSLEFFCFARMLKGQNEGIS